MEYPKVSIIIPSFNQGLFIERTIKSVLIQNYPNLELIIIDGGSTDVTIGILKKYEKHITYWVSESDKGQSHAFNKGLAKATGEYIGWLNSDDLYNKDIIAKCISVFNNKPEIDVVFGNYDFINENEEIVYKRREIAYSFNNYLWTKKCCHANIAGLFKKKCFEKFGYLREDLHYAMDYEFYLRLGLNKYKFFHIQQVLGYYRFHGNSKTVSGLVKMKKEVKLVAEEYILKTKKNRLKRFFYPVLFKYYRYFAKLFKGCYFK